MLDLSGKTFGDWTALSPVPQGRGRCVKWLCRCGICGREKLVASSSLVDGSSRRCRSCSATLTARRVFVNNRIHTIYKGIKMRCYNPSNCSYKNYGAKGIGLCDEWLNDPSSFERWALSNGYDDTKSIDRIDNNLGYSPDNCRWTSIAVQNRHRKNVYYATINGETKCVTEWCRILGFHPPTIHTRIRKGMSPYEALTTPIMHKPSHQFARD